MIPHTALSEPFPLTLADLQAIDGMGDPIGIRPFRDPLTADYCYCDKFAPGSSPHRHTILTGWQVVYTDGLIELDPDGMPRRATSLYELPTE